MASSWAVLTCPVFFIFQPIGIMPPISAHVERWSSSPASAFRFGAVAANASGAQQWPLAIRIGTALAPA